MSASLPLFGLLALFASPPQLEPPQLEAWIAPSGDEAPSDEATSEEAPPNDEIVPVDTAPPSEDPGGMPAPDIAAPTEAPAKTAQKREWMLVIAPGFDYLKNFKFGYHALGGGFRFGGQAIKWAGKKGHFLIGGGPMLHYSFIKDPLAKDTINLVTVNGDIMIGGGNQRVGVYWHATLGFGYLQAKDGGTGDVIRTVGARMASGLGFYAKIVDRFSLGVLADFGWAGGLWVNPLLTANIHFGRRGDPL